MQKIISLDLLNATSAAAKTSPRQRKNYNFHVVDTDVCQRSLNAIEPEIYIPPHCHLHPTKAESIIILRGRIGVLFFNADGEVTDKARLQPQSAY
ncbi:MAG: WbuC family cupin fold metalloprotein [Burkholderiales bacterium]